MGKATDANLLHQVEEVDVFDNEDYANRMLQEGWILLAVGSGQEQTGPNDYHPYVRYHLGRLKK